MAIVVNTSTMVPYKTINYLTNYLVYIHIMFVIKKLSVKLFHTESEYSVHPMIYFND